MFFFFLQDIGPPPNVSFLTPKVPNRNVPELWSSSFESQFPKKVACFINFFFSIFAIIVSNRLSRSRRLKRKWLQKETEKEQKGDAATEKQFQDPDIDAVVEQKTKVITSPQAFSSDGSVFLHLKSAEFASTTFPCVLREHLKHVLQAVVWRCTRHSLPTMCFHKKVRLLKLEVKNACVKLWISYTIVTILQSSGNRGMK